MFEICHQFRFIQLCIIQLATWIALNEHASLYTAQGAVRLYIKVEDYDSYNSNDDVDNVDVTITLMPNSTFTPRQWYTGVYGNSRIELSFRLQCGSNLYGSNCTTFCVARNDSEGHYSCGSDGQKMCLMGWTEPTNNCTVRKYQELYSHKISPVDKILCIAISSDTILA